LHALNESGLAEHFSFFAANCGLTQNKREYETRAFFRSFALKPFSISLFSVHLSPRES